jgi:hypothetical protein
MKIEHDDPRLTSYVLGELPAKEAKLLDHAIAGDPALKLVVKEIERTQVDLLKLLGADTDKLLPKNRSAIMRAAREASGQRNIINIHSQRKKFNIWTWPLSAAAVVAITMAATHFLLPSKLGNSDGNVGTGVDKPLGEEYVAVDHHGKSQGNIGLPLISGNKSLTQITRSIRDAGNLPSRQEVRIEEMLNAFPLDAKNSVAIWKGNTLGVEVVKCPWSPSGSLVFVKIRGAKDRSSKLTVEFQSDETAIISSRLLGYEIEQNQRQRKAMPQQLSAGQETMVALIVESKNSNLGKLVWTVDGEVAPSVELISNFEKEASSDSRFASLICGFGLWLRGENSAIIDDSLVLALAREVAAESLVADRYDFLELVDQAIKAKSK